MEIVSLLANLYPSGGTCFQSAMMQLKSEVDSSLAHNYDKYVVCFMSDGLSTYPQDEIDALKRCGSNFIQKL
jgi:hypothetical protein